jgi:hypothetical protein
MHTGRRAALLLAAALPTAGSAIPAQAPGWQAPAAGCGARHPFRAVVEAMAVNVGVNRYDAWGRSAPWAKVDFNSWSRNIRYGWEWDENEFGTNMFSHPFHGGLYFNAARSNCLDYWEAAPVAFLGSWTWEYLGERFRPALNDFFMTSFGGVALGEVFHRVGATIRDNQAVGSSRLWREIGAMVVDPVGGFNRLVRGEWSRVGPNPPEHDYGAIYFRFHVGGRFVGDSGSLRHASGALTVITDLSYGDAFARPFERPFDNFAVRLQLTPGGGGLNLLQAAGRLYEHELTSAGARNRHLFVVNQRYEYINNPAYRFGGQSVEAGIESRWKLGHGGYHLRGKATTDAIVLGAIDAPFAGVGERTYDFGPGLGLTARLVLERHQVNLLEWYNRLEYVHSVSGAQADHYVAFTGLEGTLTLARGMGLGVCLSTYARASRYTDKPPENRSFPELRVFFTWTTAREAAVVRP